MSVSEGITLDESLEGFISLHKNIAYVKNQGVLIRDDEEFKRDQKSVLLISGGERGKGIKKLKKVLIINDAGGSGHEPFPIGFVGHGMLSTAVCGQIFTSPSVTRYL